MVLDWDYRVGLAKMFCVGYNINSTSIVIVKLNECMTNYKGKPKLATKELMKSRIETNLEERLNNPAMFTLCNAHY